VSARRDVRARAAMLTVAAIALGGAIVLGLPGEAVLAQPPAPAAREVDARFTQGVTMLHAKRYEYAATAFDRVLVLAPDMPEAHVNMGFALLGLGRPADARAFFESATALRPMQANAYFGLAEALEASGDVRGAIGAMRAYLHLTHPRDPFRRRAEAALWEWESAGQPANHQK
jgi:Flp pilus assembly protein TadD